MRFSIATLFDGKHRDESDRLTLKDKMMARDCEGIIAVDRARESPPSLRMRKSGACLVQRTTRRRRDASRQIAVSVAVGARDVVRAAQHAPARRQNAAEHVPLTCPVAPLPVGARSRVSERALALRLVAWRGAPHRGWRPMWRCRQSRARNLR